MWKDRNKQCLFILQGSVFCAKLKRFLANSQVSMIRMAFADIEVSSVSRCRILPVTTELGGFLGRHTANVVVGPTPAFALFPLIVQMKQSFSSGNEGG
jgi:hypothetical protein